MKRIDTFTVPSFESLVSNRVARHVVFWIFIYLLDVFVFGIGYENVPLFLKLALLELPGQIMFAYTVMYWIIPGYIHARRKWKWIALCVLCFFVSAMIGHYMFIAFDAYSTPVDLFDLPKIFLRGIYGFLKSCLAVLVKFGMMWYRSEKRVSELETARLESELKMLKEQVNPHFLFNTLNSLYGLIASKPLLAQESVIRLSGILQFMLHESNHVRISLKRELECLRDYVDLERLRYGDRLQVSMNIDPAVHPLQVTPLLLFPLVENAFKHGASQQTDQAWINMSCLLNDNHLVFKLENSLGCPEGASGNGIGLANVRRRLELIYPGQHSFEIFKATDSYLVVLKIEKQALITSAPAKVEYEVSHR